MSYMHVCFKLQARLADNKNNFLNHTFCIIMDTILIVQIMLLRLILLLYFQICSTNEKLTL